MKDVDKITDENILRDYKELEYKYKRIFGCLTGSCYFLNRHWFQREYDSGRRDIYEIGVVCYILSLLSLERISTI